MNKKGFTLVEILVSVTLLVITAGSFFYIFKAGMKIQNEAEAKMKAAYAVESRMEELRALSFDALLNEKGVTAIDSDLLEIQANLNWNPGKNPIVIYTMRAR